MTWTPNDHDLARWRLHAQGLASPLTGAEAVVGSLLAVQAENPSQSAWAVASRTAEPDAADLAALLDDGRVVRTHVLRPTWHYVRAEDIGWLLDLTAPRVRRTTRNGLRTVSGLDDAALDRASAAALEVLDATADLTREELSAALADAGHDLDGQSLMLLLADLELQQEVVSGRPREGAHTYARFAERVGEQRRPSRDEALAELVLRYVTGHGPATAGDLAYWATLTVGDVRRGLAAVQDRLASFDHDDRTFWHAPEQEPPGATPLDPPGHLLQILDELYRGFQDSRMVLDGAGVVPRSRETAIGMALVDAQMVARMKRTLTPRRVQFALTPYDGRPLSATDLAALEDAAARYGTFLGLEAELVVG